MTGTSPSDPVGLTSVATSRRLSRLGPVRTVEVVPVRTPGVPLVLVDTHRAHVLCVGAGVDTDLEIELLVSLPSLHLGPSAPRRGCPNRARTECRV